MLARLELYPIQEILEHKIVIEEPVESAIIAIAQALLVVILDNRMKVILLRDVARIGKRSEVKDVPAGHALNFLIPRKMALPATTENLRRIETEHAHHAAQSAHHDADFSAALLTLSTTPIELPMEANAQGNLFKGVHAADIALRFKDLNIPIEVNEIELLHPIKEVGDHIVSLRAGSQSGTFTLRIVAR